MPTENLVLKYRCLFTLDHLIYNDPMGYADLVLNGDLKKHLDTVRQEQKATNNNLKSQQTSGSRAQSQQPFSAI